MPDGTSIGHPSFHLLKFRQGFDMRRSTSSYEDLRDELQSQIADLGSELRSLRKSVDDSTVRAQGGLSVLASVAGILMMFPALLPTILGEGVPVPHLLGLILAFILAALQWRTRRPA